MDVDQAVIAEICDARQELFGHRDKKRQCRERGRSYLPHVPESFWERLDDVLKNDPETSVAPYRHLLRELDGYGTRKPDRQAVDLTEALGSPPMRIQSLIWKALEGRSLTADGLLSEIKGSNRCGLFYSNRKKKTGGLRELTDKKLVENKRGLGYYRPDAPPVATK